MKLLYIDFSFTEICSCGFSFWCIGIGPGNASAPNRRQVIIRTEDGLVL